MKLSPWPGQRQKRNRSKLKQVQLYLSPEDWLRVRRHAAARHLPMTAILRELLRPGIDGLPEQPPGS